MDEIMTTAFLLFAITIQLMLLYLWPMASVVFGITIFFVDTVLETFSVYRRELRRIVQFFYRLVPFTRTRH